MPAVTWRLLPGWRAADVVTLPALRSLFAYAEGRATGWLWSACRQGQLGPLPWPSPLAAAGPAMLAALERDTGTRFTACAFQAYADGDAATGWHHDRDWDAQAIVSLGATRDLGLRRDGRQELARLAHGDLLVMPAGFQDEWEHCVPPGQATGERCSLVFRTAKGAT